MDDRFGKFTRTQLLGRGGMGEVWKAWDGQLGRWVALKFLKGTGAEDLARFQREAQIASRLNHPNIAAIYEVGPNFIAMQFVEGASPKPGDPRAVELVATAARAVHFAHERGVVHRDLKPDNLMVTPEGHLFVMDFGLARPIEGALDISRSGMLVGTPSYMPPEQATGERVDARADVYSLGATLYELVTGRRPFDAGTLLQTLAKVVSEDAPPMTGADADLRTIVGKCLEKDRERRYATAAEVADDLDRQVAGEAIAARGPSAGYRIRKFVRRRRGAVVFGIAGVLVATVTGGIVLPGLLRESTARRKGDAALLLERERAGALQELGSMWARIILARQGLYRRGEDPKRAMNAIQEAVDGVRAFIGRHPDFPQGYYVRARGNLYLGNLDAAKEDLETALRVNEAFTPGRALLGTVMLEKYRRRLYGEESGGASKDEWPRRAQGLLDEALASLSMGRLTGAKDLSITRWGLTETPEDRVTETLSRYFMTRHIENNPQQAERELEQLNQETPTAEYCNELGNAKISYDRQVEWHTKALELMPHFAKAYLDRGTARARNRDFRRAIEDYARVLEITPREVTALQNRGYVRLELREYDASIEDLTRALDLRMDPYCLATRGRARLGKRDVEGAIADYTRSVEVDPAFAPGWNGRGAVHRDQKEYVKAYHDFNQAIEVDPKYAIAWDNRGSVRAMQGDLEGAMKDHAKALELDPKHSMTWCNRGRTRMEMKDTNGALADYTRAIELDPRNATAYYNRGNAHTYLRDVTAAIADYSGSIEIEPEHRESYWNRGYLRLLAAGDPKGAVADFTKAIEGSLRLHESLFYRGKAYAQLHEGTAAAADLRKALEIAPASFRERAEAKALLEKLTHE